MLPNITPEQLREAKAQYVLADDATKLVLKNLFGESVAENKQYPADMSKDITKRVYDLPSACWEMGKDINTLFGEETSPYRKAEIAIETFTEAISQGAKDEDRIWYPYFYRSSEGEFSFSDYTYGCDSSTVGARLRVPSKELTRHIGKCMLEYYRIYLTSTK